MTKKTQEEMQREADDFVQLVHDNTPDDLTPEHLVRIMCGLMSDFCPDRDAVSAALLISAKAMATYFDQIDMMNGSDECTCPECSAERKNKAH